jgi:hypothetical protein
LISLQALGNIATGLATLGATRQASKEITALTDPHNPVITTAPSDPFQSVANSLYSQSFPQAAKAVLGIIPATVLLTQQYLASMLIASFCASYSYMNAGQPFVSGDASYSSFGTLYVPTISTFKASVKALVAGTYGEEPSAVQALSKNLNSFVVHNSGKSCRVGTNQGFVLRFSSQILFT